MRAWLETVEDKSLPLLVADAETQWRRITRISSKFYRGIAGIQPWARNLGITKVPSRVCRMARRLALAVTGAGRAAPRPGAA